MVTDAGTGELRIPKAILEQMEITEQVDLEVEENRILLKPVKGPPAPDGRRRFDRYMRPERNIIEVKQVLHIIVDVNNVVRYYETMIGSFKDKETEKIWQQRYSKRYPVDVQRVGYRKLIMLHRSKDLLDLRVPPGNRLERLLGDRAGQYSIRINDQWRICFSWTEGTAFYVEITDYH